MSSLERQRILRKSNNNASTKKYEKTKNGFLMRTYRNMKSRVSGIQTKKSHLYLGLEILDKYDFYEFSLNDTAFNILFNQWELSNYDRRLTPSIDRLESDKGYNAYNIRWITHSENSKLGAHSKWGTTPIVKLMQL